VKCKFNLGQNLRYTVAVSPLQEPAMLCLMFKKDNEEETEAKQKGIRRAVSMKSLQTH